LNGYPTNFGHTTSFEPHRLFLGNEQQRPYQLLAVSSNKNRGSVKESREENALKLGRLNVFAYLNVSKSISSPK